MELSWVNKLRIGAVAALGIVVIGLLAWPMAGPEDPLAPVRSASISFSGTLVLLVLALGTGFIGYFVAWPHGREIGILGVPFGLLLWVVRSGPMQTLTQAHTSPAGREAILQSLRFESVYWLLIVAAGFVGVLIAQHIRSAADAPPLTLDSMRRFLRPNVAILALASLPVTTVLAHFFLGVFAQDLSLAKAATQPAIGQVLFGGIAAFAVAGFVIKKFLNLSYVWPAIGTILVIPFSIATYGGSDTIQKFAETEPATQFPHVAFAILPLQLVALGTIGAVTGYWLAVRYDYWRKHESGG